MKILQLIFIAFSIIMLFQQAAGAEYDMTETNQKIKAITDKRLHLIETVIDEGNLLQSQEFLALQAKCTNDWMHITTNLDKIEGGDDMKKLAIYGLGQLQAHDYMTAIDDLIIKYENGIISESLIEAILYPMGRMRAFTKDNFNHPRVITALNRIKTKSINNILKNKLDKILTGESKASLDNFREAHQGMAEGNIPVVLLPN